MEIEKIGVIKGAVITIIGVTAATVILVFFLSITGGITPLPQPPVRVMAREMGSVSAGEFCTVSNNVVEFDRGTEIQSGAVAVKAGMNKGSVKFCCSASVGKHCKGYVFPEDKGFDCKEDVLKTTQDVHGNIRACYPATQGEPYTIGFKP